MGRKDEYVQLVNRAAKCHACDLWKLGTQTVFGEGPVTAKLVMVGEQPGDQEDKQNHVFVGPAGHVLDDLLETAGIDRKRVYLTNAVKHFKWEPRGKRRLHARANGSEIRACHGWLEEELALVRPKLVVLLGAVACQSVFGSKFSVTKERGKIIEGDLPMLATFHPSALLRLRDRDEEAFRKAKKDLIADLRKAKAFVA